MKRFITLAVLAVSLAAALSADETTEIYQMLFRQAQGMPQKYAAALNLVALGDKATAPILAQSLQELLLGQRSYTSSTDVDLYGRTVRILAQALGDYKYLDAAPFLWDTAQQVPDALAEAEAIMALGKMRALDYVDRIALKLRDLNFQPTTDRDAGEKLAYACVIALEKFKDVRGFSSVFFASDAWYSLRVRQQALQSLPEISDDPTDPIKSIISTESPERTVRALQAEADSKATFPRKTETAILALGLAQQKSPRDRDEAKLLADIRKLALRMLATYKVAGAEAVDACDYSYAKGFDDEERLLALSALGSNASDAAASALRDILIALNEDQKAGVSDETRNRMAKAAIENCGISKNKIAKPALIAITFDEKWSGGIILAAQTALKTMP